MTSVPYPTFLNALPGTDAAALSAVGRCRIYPRTCSSASSTEYESILSKCVDQSRIDVSPEGRDKEANKKLRKKLMKEGVAMARSYLSTTLKLDLSIIDVEIVVSPSDLMESDGCLAACLLDAGCDSVVCADGTALEAMDAAKIPRERLVAHFEETNTSIGGSIVTQAGQLAGTVSMSLGGTEDAVTVEGVVDIIKNVGAEDTRVVVQFSPGNAIGAQGDDAVTTLAEMVGKISKSSVGKGTVALVDPTAQQLGMSYAACMKTDRSDGLYTTVVCTRSGEALGLVYSSKESIVAALECGRGVYYSRSRNGLWRKGDTSGHYQTLHRLDVDCDGDALRFTVTQRGDDVAAFCHLNTLTCWGEPHGLRHLEGTLKQRLRDAPEGSYTKRLFDDEKLLRDKLVEEAQELSEAESKQHVAEELADVLYFAMVRAAKAGVSIDDAAAELDKRARKVTRRKGDSKAFRIAAGDVILNK